MKQNQENLLKLHINNTYCDFVPNDFKINPLKYIKERGENIKSGEIEYAEDGNISEDPTAAKFLPLWHNHQGKKIQVVSKKVNLQKVYTKTAHTQRRYKDSLLEYKMMSLCVILGLPSAKPIGFIKQDNVQYILMERITGLTWTQRDFKLLSAQGFSRSDKDFVKKQLKELMEKTKSKYEEFGIFSKWKHEDMIFELDAENYNILNITPVDWEWSHIDLKLVKQKLENLSPRLQKQVDILMKMKV